MDFAKYIIDSHVTFEYALAEMDRRATQLLIVSDSEKRLLGTVTDGDLRRAMLRKLDFGAKVTELMNANPIAVGPDCTSQMALELMLARRIHHVPIVDELGRLKGLFTENAIVGADSLDARAVLMVGGLGTRLGDLTKDCPKPMLKIGGKPILQTIVEQLVSAGVEEIHMAINYLGERIKEHFEDGDRFGCSISYVEETEPLGTAGALRLLDISGSSPLLVMNGDILTRINFVHLLRFHREHEAMATMCVREYSYQVPYGVVNVSGPEIVGIEEKPANSFFINSGIYVLDPLALNYLPADGPFGMPSLFDLIREQHKKTVAYPIHEYWMDVGSPKDFKEADDGYTKVFSSFR